MENNKSQRRYHIGLFLHFLEWIQCREYKTIDACDRAMEIGLVPKEFVEELVQKLLEGLELTDEERSEFKLQRENVKEDRETMQETESWVTISTNRQKTRGRRRDNKIEFPKKSSLHIRLGDQVDMCFVNGLLLGYPVIYSFDPKQELHLSNRDLTRFVVQREENSAESFPVTSFTVPTDLLDQRTHVWIIDWIQAYFGDLWTMRNMRIQEILVNYDHVLV